MPLRAAGVAAVTPKKSSRRKTTPKKTARKKSSSAVDDGHDPGVFESLGRQIDDVPQVRAAEEAMRQAQEKFAHARDTYEHAREHAADELGSLREKSVGDLVESASDYVSRHPGQGVLLATLFGFFLGRLFRR